MFLRILSQEEIRAAYEEPPEHLFNNAWAEACGGKTIEFPKAPSFYLLTQTSLEDKPCFFVPQTDHNLALVESVFATEGKWRKGYELYLYDKLMIPCGLLHVPDSNENAMSTLPDFDNY